MEYIQSITVMLKVRINFDKFSLTGQYFYDFNDFQLTGFWAKRRKRSQTLLIWLDKNGVNYRQP